MNIETETAGPKSKTPRSSRSRRSYNQHHPNEMTKDVPHPTSRPRRRAQNLAMPNAEFRSDPARLPQPRALTRRPPPRPAAPGGPPPRLAPPRRGEELRAAGRVPSPPRLKRSRGPRDKPAVIPPPIERAEGLPRRNADPRGS